MALEAFEAHPPWSKLARLASCRGIRLFAPTCHARKPAELLTPLSIANRRPAEIN